MIKFSDINIIVDTNNRRIEKPQTDDSNEIELINSTDTINISYGKHSIDAFEKYKYPILDNAENRLHIIKQDELDKRYYELVLNETDMMQGVHLENFYYYDTICGHLGKVMLPKKMEKNKSCVYGIKIYDIGEKKNKLTIYSTSKNENTVDEILNIIKQMKSDCR